MFNTDDGWKTNINPANVNIQKGANTCRITQFTTNGPLWRGVTLYNEAVKQDGSEASVLQRCGYFMSPPINWNSLGDWEADDANEYKLASIFSIDLLDYQDQSVKTTFRQVYSCFFDSIRGMDCGVKTAGLGAGPFSGAVVPSEYLDDSPNRNPIPYFEPEEGNGRDFTTDVDTDDMDLLENYLFRVQIEFIGDDGKLEIYNKSKEGAQTSWEWGNLVDDVTGQEPDEIPVTQDDQVAIETYVAPSVSGNCMICQIVIKTQTGGGGAWVIRQSVSGIFPNYLGFHRLCDKGALDSKVGKPANIRFSYATNAPNSSLFNVGANNYTQPGNMYWAGAYNPIDEANGFVNGAFRPANYITTKSANLPANLPAFIFGDEVIGETDKLVIAQDNPNNGVIVEWRALGDARLEETGANAGIILGLDEQGWQYVNSNSFTNGIVFSGAVNLNARDFPQHYLDLPDLAIRNHTGVVDGTGRPNHFICPLDLNSGAGTNNLHSSQNETLLYNDLGNAMEERLTNLRIRICDLEGTPSPNLQNYTLGCLEVRENPQMKQMKMQRALQRQEEEVLAYQSGVNPNRGNRYQ